MNKVILIGRLTNEPTLKQNEKSSLVKFTLAVSRLKDGVDFISCIAWNKTAELINKYMHKGSQLALEGRIQTGSYEDKQGVTHYTTDVIVDNVTFVGNKETKEEVKEEKESAWEDLGNTFKADEIVLNDEDLPF